MSTVYAVEWDNGDGYEDHAAGIIRIFGTLDKAEVYRCVLENKCKKDAEKITKLDLEDRFEESRAIELWWKEVVPFYFHLESISFRVIEYPFEE